VKWSGFPRSLFSRLVLLLLFGLVMAEAITVLVTTRDRGEAIQQTVGLYSAQRIAGIVRILEQMPAGQRQETVKVLDAPGMRISLTLPPIDPETRHGSSDGTLFLAALQFYLDGEREVRLDIADAQTLRHFDRHDPLAMGMNPHMHQMMRQHMAEAGLFIPTSGRHLIQVRLRDGQWVSFGEQLPEGGAAWPLRISVALVLVLLILGLVALLAVRWITRPLDQLERSAKALGQDLKHPPLQESGPEEVRATLHAFNTMQKQIRRFVEERSRFLAAISHDLKTPITRLRLRSGLLEDKALQEKFERDLAEMEVLVQGILDFMRDEADTREKQAMDINDLLEILQIDREEAGAVITIKGKARDSFPCHPLSMRRMIANLVDNAIKYAGAVEIEVEDSAESLRIRVSDRGPGIPDTDLERVLEPFSRLEGSRSRSSGGTGLGLAIAKNIALAHGGTLTLRNRVQGGLSAEINLPR